ncbi:BQ5605_C022g09533 [Microbotryum silenes-dioicae]|uniref:BQ5605_C022g09533 protein n=1 Tax=Microbotryum silenes-dioicae TaxID=796604 RepID=A0A2X0N713_9BASI|nr:BQ5605_C022g09533 [Microbotryum silenes-dioicae]
MGVGLALLMNHHKDYRIEAPSKETKARLCEHPQALPPLLPNTTGQLFITVPSNPRLRPERLRQRTRRNCSVSTLRSKEQLGYIVSSSTWSLYSLTAFRIIVQSEHAPEYLESRIKALWSSFEDVLSEMTEEALGKQKQSLMDKKREKVKNSCGESLARGIGMKFRKALWISKDALLVSTLTRADLVNFFNTYIRPGAPKLSKLSILMRSRRLQSDALKALEEVLPGGNEKVKALLESKPTLGQLEAGIQALYPEGQGIPQRIKEELEKVGRLPELEGEGVKELPEEEIDEWRKGLEKAERLGAREDHRSDLEVTSKL